jgi:DNA-binding NtrC family response regulator
MTRQRRVLVVDDDLDALYYVDDVLAEIGYRPIKATSVDDAADVIAEMDVDALVVNVAMLLAASASALAQLEHMRRRIPVLVMSGSGRRPGGAASPARAFLEHPPAEEALAEAIEQCLAVPAGPHGA